MDYTYTAYTKDRKLVKGKLTAANLEIANRILDYGGYQVVNLKPTNAFLSLGSIPLTGASVKPKDVLLFARQLALLLESGTDLVASLELIQKQTTVKGLGKILTDIIHEIRSGSSFSAALGKHPGAFSSMFIQAMAAGEQAGNLDVVLRQMADYINREVTTGKKVKNAMTYPVIIFVLAIVVVGLLAVFVMPVFTNLFSSFGAKLPLFTRILIGIADWASHYALWVIGALLIIIGAGYAYIRTPNGKLQWDTISLRLPVVGRINLLNELSRCCRTMALLFKVGLPLPEILGQAIRGSDNKAFANSLTLVQQELIKGEGLSKPMSRDPLFLPLMVQMISVGEETGNLDNALTTVAASYETESDDRTGAAVGFIQPALTVGIALVIGFVAVAMVSAMYGIYGQINL
jgi:type IV pilus assembly protein PilC